MGFTGALPPCGEKLLFYEVSVILMEKRTKSFLFGSTFFTSLRIEDAHGTVTFR